MESIRDNELLVATIVDPPVLERKAVQPRVRVLRPDLPDGFDAFFDRALAKEPADRYASGAALAARLRQLVDIGEG